jgi:hypothetical protein
VLVDDELPAQGNHEEDAEPAAEEGEGEDARGFEIEAEKDEGREGEDDAGGDGLAGVSGGLHDIVFEDAGLAEGAEDGDREHRDGNARGHGKPRAQANVHRHRAEEHAEDGAQQQRTDGQLRARFRCGDKGPKARLGYGRGGHVVQSPACDLGLLASTGV